VPPFNDETVDEIFQNILTLKIEWPKIGYEEDCLSPEAADLINQLLCKDFESRLGSGGAEEVKRHRFF